jgi:hypothetical protein
VADGDAPGGEGSLKDGFAFCVFRNSYGFFAPKLHLGTFFHSKAILISGFLPS